MSQYQSSPLPPSPGPAYPPAPPNNTIGLIGFICSLVGIVSALGGLCCLPLGFLSVLCIVGVILSAIGLKREPRGMAVAGLITGLIGVVVAVAMFVLFGALIGVGVSIAKKEMATVAVLGDGQAIIDQEIQLDGTPPDDADGQALIGGLVDGWGNALRYETTDDGYDIISSGQDGVFDTYDDKRLSDLLSLRGGTGIDDWLETDMGADETADPGGGPEGGAIIGDE